jgi:hypothetical protein
MSNTKTPELERQARQRERGLWNFLTWSFFLSQVITDSPFAAAAGASSANVEETSEHGNAARHSSVQPPMRPAAGSGLDGGEGATGAQSVSAVAASQLASPEIDAHALSQFTEADVAGGSPRQVGVMGASGGWHVASASDLEAEHPPANSPDDSATGGGPGINLPDVLPPVGSGVVELIDDLLDPPLSAIGEVVGDLSDCLIETISDVTDLVGNSIALLPKTLDTVLSTTLPAISAFGGETIKGAITPVTTTLEKVTDGLSDIVGLDKLVGGGLVSAPGQILFKPLSIGGDLLPDLFSKGKYTDYNLALRAEHGGDTQGNAGAAATSSSTLLDTLLSPDTSHPQGDSHASPTPFQVIDDIGRGLSGDWLNH